MLADTGRSTFTWSFNESAMRFLIRNCMLLLLDCPAEAAAADRPLFPTLYDEKLA